jgi:GNAT superfamily N-acetyltransferase
VTGIAPGPASTTRPVPHPGVITAGPADADALSDLIAQAFLHLPPSRWLIGDPAARRAVFPSYFAIHVEHALATGIVHTTPDRTAAALWLPVSAGRPASPAGYDARLAAATGRWHAGFTAFDAELEAHHPAGIAHHHLALLAVHPDHQGQGTGSLLLAAHHAALDQDGIPAYLEAATTRTRRLYARHGYFRCPGPPIRLPGEGPLMWPMWREPHQHLPKQPVLP